MVKQIKWFERTFDFNFPVGILPCILERFRGTPGRIEECVRFLPTEILTTRVDGEWSIQEHVGHVLDLESLGEQRLRDFRSGAPVLSAADLTNRKTHEAGHNADSLQNILSRFRKARAALVVQLELLNEEEAGRSSIHPRLNKPMGVVDWCYFMAEHDDHHLATMVSLARKMRKGK